MNLHTRLAKLEARHAAQQPSYVVRLIEHDESFNFAAELKAAKIERGWEDIPDDDIFVIHRVFVKPLPRPLL